MFLPQESDRIGQGSILKNIEYEITALSPNKQEVIQVQVVFPYAVVLNQDCDLTRDFEIRFDKIPREKMNLGNTLYTILLAPMFNADLLREGKHFDNLGIECKRIHSESWSRVKINDDKRYHFTPSEPKLDLPNLVIDFKHFFTLPTSDIYDYLKPEPFLRFDDLYREEVSQRFAYYISRIGLPELNLDK